ASVDLPFAVRQPTPGTQGKILLVLPDATYTAYNSWGGRDVYGYQFGGEVTNHDGTIFGYPQNGLFIPYAFHVAFDRTVGAAALHEPAWQRFEGPFLRWAAGQGIAIEVATSRDIINDPPNPQQYRLLVFVGHHEYWTRTMRVAVEQFA